MDTEHVFQATDAKQPRENQMRGMFVCVNAISRIVLSSYDHSYSCLYHSLTVSRAEDHM